MYKNRFFCVRCFRRKEHYLQQVIVQLRQEKANVEEKERLMYKKQHPQIRNATRKFLEGLARAEFERRLGILARSDLLTGEQHQAEQTLMELGSHRDKKVREIRWVPGVWDPCSPKAGFFLLKSLEKKKISLEINANTRSYSTHRYFKASSHFTLITKKQHRIINKIAKRRNSLGRARATPYDSNVYLGFTVCQALL